MGNSTILLGSNIENRTEYLEQARNMVEKHCGFIQNKSEVYESEAWGFNSTPFLNQILIINTTLTPNELLLKTQWIEISLGRNRIKTSNQKYEARTIDIDLIFYEDLIIDTPTLQLPHPKIEERRFVLTPLAEIIPYFVHPKTNKTIQNMLLSCQDRGNVIPFGK